MRDAPISFGKMARWGVPPTVAYWAIPGLTRDEFNAWLAYRRPYQALALDSDFRDRSTVAPATEDGDDSKGLA